MSYEEKWQEWKLKGDQYKLREELKDYKFTMFEKIKPFVPVAILVLLTAIIIYWGVMLSLKVETLTGQNLENRQAITQIATFIQNANKPK